MRTAAETFVGQQEGRFWYPAAAGLPQQFGRRTPAAACFPPQALLQQHIGSARFLQHACVQRDASAAAGSLKPFGSAAGSLEPFGSAAGPKEPFGSAAGSLEPFGSAAAAGPKEPFGSGSPAPFAARLGLTPITVDVALEWLSVLMSCSSSKMLPWDSLSSLSTLSSSSCSCRLSFEMVTTSRSFCSSRSGRSYRPRKGQRQRC
eukprot:220307-Chlamydomonas_euryale.AAC.1